MKGEYVEDNQADNNNNNHQHANAIPLQTHHPNPHDIFPKYPPPHHLHHHHNLHPHSFLSPTPPTKKPKTTPILITPPQSLLQTQTQDDGGTVETSRKPRGRPPGSKNKPKPPIIITREPDQPNMSPYILELPNNSDMVESLTRFTRRRGVGLCVLTASGAVSNLILRQPSTSSTSAPPATVTFHGRFEILSLSAVVLHNENGNSSLNFNLSFTISVAGPQGQIVGGKVVGPLVTAGTVYVIAASFNSPSFQRLPLEDSVVQQQQQQQQQEVRNDGVSRSHDDDDQGRNDTVSGASGSVSGGNGGGGGPVGMYTCQDVIWAPTPGRPHPTPQQHQQQQQGQQHQHQAPPY